MTTTEYGSKYAATKHLSKTEIAKLIRSDIKAAVKAGKLPVAKYYVNTHYFAGGSSIDVRFAHVKEDGFVLLNPERVRFDLDTDSREFTRLNIYSVRAEAIMSELKAISDAYNFDGSDTQTDYFHVRFYGDQKPDWRWESDVSKTERAAIATEMAGPKKTAHVDYLETMGVA